MLLCELQTKDVINVCTAKCLGRVMDLEIDEKRGCICTLIVPSKGKICGFFLHECEYWKFVMARDEKDYDKFVEKVLEHSLWNIGKKPKYGKKMLMLSTCDNGKGDDWRIVVVGKEI